jgi:hypothetical protein
MVCGFLTHLPNESRFPIENVTANFAGCRKTINDCKNIKPDVSTNVLNVNIAQ